MEPTVTIELTMKQLGTLILNQTFNRLDLPDEMFADAPEVIATRNELNDTLMKAFKTFSRLPDINP